MTRNTARKKDGSFCRPTGPYWYAYWYDSKGIHSVYIGKELPPECIPYATERTTPSGLPDPVELPEGANRNRYDHIKEALDKGAQVVIDLDAIAASCSAYCDQLEARKFLLYRDPQ